jgi:hypothetical protein
MTILGLGVNVALTAAKGAGGIVFHSSALLADGKILKGLTREQRYILRRIWSATSSLMSLLIRPELPNLKSFLTDMVD